MLENCEEGSSNSVPVWPYVAIATLFLVGFGGSRAYNKVRDKLRVEREDKRKQLDMAILNPVRQSAVSRAVSKSSEATLGKNLQKIQSFGYEVNDRANSELLESESSYSGSTIPNDNIPIDFEFQDLGLNIKGSGRVF